MKAAFVTVLILAQAAPSDTLVMVVARDGLQTAAAWSTIVVGVFFLLLVPLLLLVLVQVRKLDRTIRGIGEKGLARVEPLVEGGKSITDNVEFITMAVRSDVEHLHTSLKALGDRLHQASDRMEERIEEFNALMEVVQSEAEDIFVGTASTVRGVRAGARSLSDEGARVAGEPRLVGSPGPERAPMPPHPSQGSRAAGATNE